MIKVIFTSSLILILSMFSNVINARVASDSFEDGIPSHWKLKGRGKLSISDFQAKLGNKSLRWDWKGGDIITISNKLGDIKRRSGGMAGTGKAAFGIWIYNYKATRSNLTFEFKNNKSYQHGASFKFPLNFDKWQCGFVQYRARKSLFSKKVPYDCDTINIKAPAFGSGTLLLDLVVYNGGLDERINFVPLSTPWKAAPPPANLTAGIKVQDADIKALKKLEELLLPKQKITSAANPKVERIIQKLKSWKIKVLPDGNTQGAGIQVPSVIGLGHYSYSFFTDNNIPAAKVKSLRMDVVINLERVNRCFAAGINNEQKKLLVRELLPFIRHVVNQGFNTSYGIPINFVYYKNVITRSVYYLSEYLDDDLRHDLAQFLQCSSNSIFEKQWKKINMDYFYSCVNFFTLVNISFTKPVEKVAACRYLSARISREICKQNYFNGFKPDGSMYHHQRHYLAYGLQGLFILSRMAYAFEGSSMAISEPAFAVLKNAAMKYYYASVDNTIPLALQGRHPFYRSSSRHLPEILKHLALSAPDGLDEQLAQAYANVNPHDTKFVDSNGIEPATAINLNIAMPYAGLSIHRRNKWLALASGYGKYFSGSEIYAGKNRFGRYTSNGSLDILGPEGFAKSGNLEDGWDWRRINGTTSIYTPISRLRPVRKATAVIYTEFGFFGGISWFGRNGCFGMKMQGLPYDKTFTGQKSYFMIDNRIYALGSNINCADKKNPVQTTLFQKALTAPDAPEWLDGKKLTNFPVTDKVLASSSDHRLIDNVGNGYFVPVGQKLLIARKNQQSRDSLDRKNTSGNFATAWIDHGTAPCNAGYMYVVFPYCEPKALKNFSANDYKIIKKDKQAHALFDKDTGITGAVIFSAGNISYLEPFENVNQNCMIMFKKDGKRFEVAIGNPDLNRPKVSSVLWGSARISNIRVVLKGHWNLKNNTQDIRIIKCQRNNTEILIKCQHGKACNFILEEKI